MNIFVLDNNINKCTEYMVDRHVVKMLTETAQILNSAYYYTGEQDKAKYRLTHSNHPCCIWVRRSCRNWKWLYRLGLSMYDEYQHRYGQKQHKAGEVIKTLTVPSLPDIPSSPQPLCMPEIYHREDVVESYRAYYNGEKQHIFRWTGREVPPWINQFQAEGDS